MKKIKLLLFALVICLISVSGVSASKNLTCVYKHGYNSDCTYGSKYYFEFEGSKVKMTYKDPNDNEDPLACNEEFTIELNINGDLVTDIEVVYKYSDPVSNGYNESLVNKIVLTNKDVYLDVKFDESRPCPEKINIGFTKDEKLLITIKDRSNFEGKLTHELSTTSSQNLGSSQCYNYRYESTCQNSLSTGKVACVWVENEDAANGVGYCNVDNLLYVGCGGASDIPVQVPAIISLVVNLLKIATPIILIFVSIITLLKAMSAQKEDEIKKATSSLIRKIIASTLVFFVVSIVQFIVSVVASDDADYNNFSNCLDCFLNNDCKINTYYKTSVGGEDYCTSLLSGERKSCLYTGRIKNDYYQGKRLESCSGKYFSDGYQPDSININGKCYKLEDSGSEIVVVLSNLDDILKYNTQTLLTANGKYYYWDTKENKYVEVSENIEIVTPYYKGAITKDCGNGYFSNGYQPRDISINGTCYKLEESGNTVLVSYVRLDLLSEQKLWKANGSCYYWNAGYDRYDEVACDTQLINRYYIGKLAEAGSEGYFDNGYQPREIKIDGTWYKLEDSGYDHTFWTVLRNGEFVERTQKKWVVNGIYYYWDPYDNEYIKINY